MSPKISKVFIKTFGCQMNLYDSDKIADVLHHAQGMTQTGQIEEADLVLFNTCSIREKAQEKVFSDLGRVRELKEQNPELLIGVGGCVGAQEGEAILQRAPYVDLVFGPQTLHRLPELLARRQESGQPQVDISFPEIEKFDRLPPARRVGGSVFVSVMEGCSKYCSFCVVPYTRGEEISRPLDDVLGEAALLAERGAKEITLLGQNVNAYRGAMGGSGGIADFAMLLTYLHEVPGIMRIRYTTSHPREMSARLIACYHSLPKLASHLHLPVQSGSDRMLAAMKRGYTALEYKSIVRRLRAARPGLCLSSDFIVGFPGEREADFMQTMRLVEEVGFDASYSFLYSPRPGTPAAELPDDTPAGEKTSRLLRLQAQLDTQARTVQETMVGSVQQVMVEGQARRAATEVEGGTRGAAQGLSAATISPGSRSGLSAMPDGKPLELAGRTENNRIVNFPGDVQQIGQFLAVKITQAYAHSLRGELLETVPAAAQS